MDPKSGYFFLLTLQDRVKGLFRESPGIGPVSRLFNIIYCLFNSSVVAGMGLWSIIINNYSRY